MLAAPVDVGPFLEDSSGYLGAADRAFQPSDVSEVREIVNQAALRNIPLTIAGAGTGLAGGRVPSGGWVVSLDRFRELDVQRGRARCGAGVVLADLQAAAGRTQQFLGPNPTEWSACIGGIVGTNAGGARSFRFGPVGRQVLSLEVTFMDGSAVRLRRGEKVDFSYRPVRAPSVTKTVAGYPLRPGLEWVDLISGSEGTLGIVTEAELILLPEPPAILSGVVFFPNQELALDAVDVWRPVPGLRLLESMDTRALDLLRSHYRDISPRARAALMIEQDLSSEDDAEVDLWTERLGRQSGLEESWFGFTAADRRRFAEFRHALPAMTVEMARRSGSKFSTDFAVPLNKNREIYAYYCRRCEEVFPGRYTIFGHIGDANVHVNLLPAGPQDAARAEALLEDFAHRVLSLGGTVAAEHGIGKQKKNLLKLMYSADEIEAMKAVKRHLDPKWLLGQGTIFDAE